MRKLGISLVLGLVAVVSAVQTPAQSAVPVTLIKVGRLLDPRTGNVLAPAAVPIEGAKIKQVGSASQIGVPAGAKIIDLGIATLLPGLIDGHTHLLLDVIVPSEAEYPRQFNGDFVPDLLLAIVESPSKRVLLGAQMAREDFESGFTTVRNLGHSGIDGDATLRDAINAGRVPGPRILASGRKLAQQGDYVQSRNPALAEAILQQQFLSVDGPDEAWRAVQKNLLYSTSAAHASTAQAQQPAPTVASVVDNEVSAVEKQILDVAEAMPEDKFNFSPEGLNIPGSDYKGVRSFAVQLKHVAASNYFIWSHLTGEKLPDGLNDGNGPANLRTKADIIRFLKESFALGHKAAATLTTDNLLQVPAGSKSTRLQLAEFGISHASDHYGQIVEYLRMNGIVPPASRPKSE
jgi:uncharacterized damage-inducible protein DinB